MLTVQKLEKLLRPDELDGLEARVGCIRIAIWRDYTLEAGSIWRVSVNSGCRWIKSQDTLARTREKAVEEVVFLVNKWALKKFQGFADSLRELQAPEDSQSKPALKRIVDEP